MDSAPQKPTTTRRMLGFGVRVLVTAALVGVAAYMFEWKPILGALAEANALVVAGALTAFLCSVLVTAQRWRRMLTKHQAGVSLLWCFRVYLESYLVGLALPTFVGGDAYRALRVRQHASGLAAAAVNVVAERAIGAVVLLCFACIGLLVHPVVSLPLWERGLIVGGLALAVPAALFTVRLTTRIPGLDRLAPYVEQARAYLSPARDGAELIGWSFVSNMLTAVSVYLLASAVGVDAGFGFFLVLYPALVLLALVPALGGLGPAHGGLAAALIQIGENQEVALAVALLLVSAQLFTASLGGVSLLLANGPRTTRPPR